MREWSCDSTVVIHDTTIDLIVTGTPIRGDTSVGEAAGWHMDDAHLCWQDSTPLDMNTLHMIGDEQHKRVIAEADERLRDSDYGKPDPDYLRDMREDR